MWSKCKNSIFRWSLVIGIGNQMIKYSCHLICISRADVRHIHTSVCYSIFTWMVGSLGWSLHWIYHVDNQSHHHEEHKWNSNCSSLNRSAQFDVRSTLMCQVKELIKPSNEEVDGTMDEDMKLFIKSFFSKANWFDCLNPSPIFVEKGKERD